MLDFEKTDYFSDPALLEDPYGYYEHLRGKGNVVPMPEHNIVAVVGYDEMLAVYRDDENFSALSAVNGPFGSAPFPADKDDITEEIERFRSQAPFGGLVATQDPPLHSRTRSLMAGVLTPKRLRENEEFMWGLTDRQIDKFIGRGRFESVGDFGLPIATQTIAELLGVPEADHQTFSDLMGRTPIAPGQYGGAADAGNDPLAGIGMYFFQKLGERRAQPTEDVLSVLANATYQDGALPEIADVIGIAAFLFAAGQDTTVSLVTASLRLLAEDLDIQARLRQDRSLIPNFIEEMLRTEGTVKAHFRLVKRPVKVGDLDVRPGTHVMLIPAAANRDPRRFERPHDFIVDRKNAREHLSFGRGIHACIGSPLARAEAKAALERLFERVGEFRIDEAFHGPAGARRYDFVPSFMFRVRTSLHLEFDHR
jgi:cytochrome P450